MTTHIICYIFKVLLIKSRHTRDFGPGFYCTVIREQAERWARRYDTPIVNIYTVRLNIADYIDGIITRDQFWSLARFKYPTHQINFCTAEALQCLEFVRSKEVLQ